MLAESIFCNCYGHYSVTGVASLRHRYQGNQIINRNAAGGGGWPSCEHTMKDGMGQGRCAEVCQGQFFLSSYHICNVFSYRYIGIWPMP
jgi:hypothetical protein